jgi:hypothetical protein
MPEEVSKLTISHLARDVAQGLVPLNTILARAHLTADQFDQITSHPFFKNRLEEELEAWSGDVRSRVQAKAATLIEESLDEIFLLVHDRTQPLNHKIDALKFAARLAAMEDGSKNADASDKVVININLGDNNKLSFEKEHVVEPKVIEGVVETMS